MQCNVLTTFKSQLFKIKTRKNHGKTVLRIPSTQFDVLHVFVHSCWFFVNYNENKKLLHAYNIAQLMGKLLVFLMINLPTRTELIKFGAYLLGSQGVHDMCLGGLLSEWLCPGNPSKGWELLISGWCWRPQWITTIIYLSPGSTNQRSALHTICIMLCWLSPLGFKWGKCW